MADETKPGRLPLVTFGLRLPPGSVARVREYWVKRYPGLSKGTPARLIFEMGLRQAEVDERLDLTLLETDPKHYVDPQMLDQAIRDSRPSHLSESGLPFGGKKRPRRAGPDRPAR